MTSLRRVPRALTGLVPLALGVGLALVVTPAAGALAATRVLPTTLTVSGTARLVVADPRDRGPASLALGHVEEVVAVVDGLGVRLGEVPDVAPNRPVTLTVSAPYGTSPDEAVERLAAAADDVTVVDATQPAAPRRAAAPAVTRTAVPTTGTHSITVLPVWWGAAPDATVGQLSTLAARSATFWEDQSGGALDVTTSVRPWRKVTLAADVVAGCDFVAIAAAAFAANPAVVTSSVTDHLVVYFPGAATCGWAGLGYVGWNTLWVNGYLDEGVTEHELGHNLGLGHANGYQCVTDSWQVTLSSTCTSHEYADRSDVMGFGSWDTPTGDVNPAEADYLGWLAAVDVDPAEVTSALTVDVHAPGGADAVRALRIPLPAGPGVPANTLVYIGYRSTAGPYADDWLGVQAHLMIGARRPWTQLVSLRPSRSAPTTSAAWYSPGWVSPALPVGTAWRVPGTSLLLRVQSQDAAAARIQVWDDATTDLVAPTSPGGPTVRQQVSAGSRVTGLAVSWAGSTDARSGVQRYTVRVDGRVVATAGATARSVVVPASAVAAVRPLAGRHTVSVVASDGAGLTSAAAWRWTTVDTTRPAAPALSARVLDARHVAVRFTASSDAQSGVAAYHLLRNGSVVARVTPVPGRAAWTTTVAVPVGTTTVAVRVTNGAGLQRVVAARVTTR
ncbi:hypothetical protein [Kineosporia sp. A_224]|uniref:hypothetical protein n=1 Tax=Kineosporia sp. A_224 TaxID=1962180 RepID=UPI000B4B3417|nr:hypothetical protein [Kineosporia sp. A_224]